MRGKQTLETFYRTTEWEKLRQTLKLERVNADGELICEYCGKPIIRACDAICHHKIHLTEDNVNDATIALNGANIAIVHHRCHNLIHEKLQTKRREIFLIYGSPLAGKRTFVQRSMLSGDLLLDIDRIWQALSGQERGKKPKEITANVFDLWRRLLDQVKTRLGEWRNAYIIGGFPLSAERERLCRQLGAREIYIESTKAECIARIKDAGQNPESWMRYIELWWDRYTPPTLR